MCTWRPRKKSTTVKTKTIIQIFVAIGYSSGKAVTVTLTSRHGIRNLVPMVTGRYIMEMRNIVESAKYTQPGCVYLALFSRSSCALSIQPKLPKFSGNHCISAKPTIQPKYSEISRKNYCFKDLGIPQELGGCILFGRFICKFAVFAGAVWPLWFVQGPFCCSL